MSKGWIWLHRSMLDWEWYDDHNTTRLFIHLLLRANHKPKRWRGKLIGRGQLWTSLDSLQNETGLSKKKIRTSLSKLEGTGEAASQGDSTGRMITILKYDSYQQEGTPTGKEGANEGQARGKQGAANKNVKNVKNVNNEKEETLSPSGSGNDVPDCPHEMLVQMFNTIPELPNVRKITPARKKSLTVLWNSDKDYQTLEFWENLYAYINTQDLLLGKKTTWSLTWDWLINPNNLIKVLEGNYE